MIAAVKLTLIAQNDAYLPATHGKFLHAAFFKYLQQLNPQMAAYVHDELNVKLFTLSELMPETPLQMERGAWHIKKDMQFSWHLTALNTLFVEALQTIQAGQMFRVGKLMLCVQAQQMHNIEAETLIQKCLQEKAAKKIAFYFLSPVAFRYFKDDYPLPLPNLVFGSLADKWNKLALPFTVERKEIERVSSAILPLEWQGSTQKKQFNEHQSLLGFTGRFNYSLKLLDNEQQHLFLINCEPHTRDFDHELGEQTSQHI